MLMSIFIYLVVIIAFTSTATSNYLNDHWIVLLHDECNHEHLEQHAIVNNLEITHTYKRLLKGAAVRGSQEVIKQSSCVKSVVRNTVLKLAPVAKSKTHIAVDQSYDRRKLLDSQHYSWGVDRLDQTSLPLDGSYNVDFKGSGVDVYVVDTGIDCTHSEFKTTSGNNRIVRNIYDAFLPEPSKISTIAQNIDDVGHGTHCAGIIGGNTIGVSPGANIYGLKVLNSKGEGVTSDTVASLEYIAETVLAKRGSAPSASARNVVVSMSLGGPCADILDCSIDPLSLAVEELATSYDIIVSVAAGNEGCNACSGSPNSAYSVIRAGATDINDNVAYFSNYGACVDVFAPGVDIVSACSSLICTDPAPAGKAWFTVKSGTSMACPHVTGVVAQLLEKSGYTADVDNVVRALTCDGSKEVLLVDSLDTVSKNLLLQTPKSIHRLSTERGLTANRIVDAACDALLKSCSSLECSGRGFCLKSRNMRQFAHSVFYDGLTLLPTAHSIEDVTSTCHCDVGYFGEHCQFEYKDTVVTIDKKKRAKLSTEFTCPPGLNLVLMELSDVAGDGWQFAKYAIVSAKTSDSLISDDAYDSLCFGGGNVHAYCLPGGKIDSKIDPTSGSEYYIELSGGLQPEAVEWSLCSDSDVGNGGIYGGVPYHGKFVVNNISDDVKFVQMETDDYSLQDKDDDDYDDDNQDDDGNVQEGEYITKNATFCRLLCDDGVVVEVNLVSASADGWNLGYYAVYSSNGHRQLFGGTLSYGISRIHNLCLPGAGSGDATSRGEAPGATSADYIFTLLWDGSNPSAILYEVCGVIGGGGRSTVRLSVTKDETGKYTCKGVLVPAIVQPAKIAQSACNQLNSVVPFYAFDLIGSDHGARNTSLLITVNNHLRDTQVVRENVNYGIFDGVCVPDGCYDFSVAAYNGELGNKGKHINIGTDAVLNSTLASAWSFCGYKSPEIPFSGTFCIEQQYGFCYGLTGCPVMKSYIAASDHVGGFFSVENENEFRDLVAIVPVHGVSELCGMPDGCYELFVGAGRTVIDSKTYNVSSSYHICGEIVPFPSTVSVCLSANSTVCEVTDVVRPHCEKSKFLHTMVKIDAYGDGWASGYRIYGVDDTGTVGDEIAKGTLLDGSYGEDHLCLHSGCYAIEYSGYDRYASEVSWVLCGHVGSGYDDNSNRRYFCIDKAGVCSFMQTDADGGMSPEFGWQDDDFFNSNFNDDDFVEPVSRNPTVQPSSVPSKLPISSVAPSAPSTATPTARTTMTPTMAPTLKPSVAPSFAPSAPAVVQSKYATSVVHVDLELCFESSARRLTGVVDTDLSFIQKAFAYILLSAGSQANFDLSIVSIVATVTGQEKVMAPLSKKSDSAKLSKWSTDMIQYSLSFEHESSHFIKSFTDAKLKDVEQRRSSAQSEVLHLKVHVDIECAAKVGSSTDANAASSALSPQLISVSNILKIANRTHAGGNDLLNALNSAFVYCTGALGQCGLTVGHFSSASTISNAIAPAVEYDNTVHSFESLDDKSLISSTEDNVQWKPLIGVYDDIASSGQGEKSSSGTTSTSWQLGVLVVIIVVIIAVFWKCCCTKKAESKYTGMGGGSWDDKEFEMVDSFNDNVVSKGQKTGSKNPIHKAKVSYSSLQAEEEDDDAVDLFNPNSGKSSLSKAGRKYNALTAQEDV